MRIGRVIVEARGFGFVIFHRRGADFPSSWSTPGATPTRCGRRCSTRTAKPRPISCRSHAKARTSKALCVWEHVAVWHERQARVRVLDQRATTIRPGIALADRDPRRAQAHEPLRLAG